MAILSSNNKPEIQVTDFGIKNNYENRNSSTKKFNSLVGFYTMETPKLPIEGPFLFTIIQFNLTLNLLRILFEYRSRESLGGCKNWYTFFYILNIFRTPSASSGIKD